MNQINSTLDYLDQDNYLIEDSYLLQESPKVNNTRNVQRKKISRRQLQKRRRARTLIGLSLLVVIGAGFSAVSQASNSNNATDPHVGLIKIRVVAGETLWSIAGAIDSANTGSIASEISDLNSLTSSNLTPGESIWVPAAK
jgi:predicted ABC-type sugar transport system permease subunit